MARTDLGVSRPAKIKTSTLVDSTPLGVLDVDKVPMPAEAAWRLPEGLPPRPARSRSSTPHAISRNRAEGTHLRPDGRRDVDLPQPRERHLARGRAPAFRGVARPAAGDLQVQV